MQTTTPQASHQSGKKKINKKDIAPHVMQVRKRNGSLVPVDVTKIVTRVTRCCQGLTSVDPLRVATKAISGLYDGATTEELDNLAISTASMLIGEEPQYSKLAARLLSLYIDDETNAQDIDSFPNSIMQAHALGLISDEVAQFVEDNQSLLAASVKPYRTEHYEYFGLRTIFDRYLLKHPKTRKALETPQFFLMRVACGLSKTPEDAIEFYDLISSTAYMPSTPTLFNSATRRPQMSSCYLLDSPEDNLKSIYEKYADVAFLSKYAGGIGLAYHKIRSRGSLIQGTNGHSNGIVPWLKTLDSSVSAVNQGGKRKGACCVYLETWHADMQDFLELRDNTGDEAKRTHNLNLANWVPDLFMKRVEADATWSLFDPKTVPHLVDLFGEEFETAYVQAEQEGLAIKEVKARDLYSRMMKTLAQTGNGWMTFKDHSNAKANQTLKKENVIHLSNLCTEILEVTNVKETAVCNLGSINLSQHVVDGKFDFAKLRRTAQIAVKYLDRVVDINFYPIEKAEFSNKKWRPVGLGQMGLQDVFFKLRIPFDSPEALELTRKITEEIYLAALETSCALAEELGAHETFADTRAAQGDLQFDLWKVEPTEKVRWEKVKKKIAKHGLRNSLIIAIAPTATIASIVGSYEAIEPMVSNLFKRETLSGEFLQINRYLVEELKELGLWTDEIRSRIKAHEGSIQNITEIPEEIRKIYRTAWELPQKALIDMAAARGPYIDQSQSLNLFMESPTIGKLSSMYMYAWKQGLKTTYYLRSRPATSISQTTISNKKTYTEAEALACSLENPESCEACS